MSWGTYLLAFFPPGSAGAVAPLSGTEIAQFALGAWNLGVTGWLCWVFFNNKLHSDGEMERARSDLARTEETARTELARAVEAARTDLLRENERILGQLARVEEQRDAALAFGKDLAPVMYQFTSSTEALVPIIQTLIPILQELTRYRDDPRKDRDDRR